jgi:hypothetical protein
MEDFFLENHFVLEIFSSKGFPFKERSELGCNVPTIIPSLVNE